MAPPPFILAEAVALSWREELDYSKNSLRISFLILKLLIDEYSLPMVILMKDIHIGAHINTRSLVFTNPILKYMTSLHFKDVFNKKTSYLGLVNTFYGFLI